MQDFDNFAVIIYRIGHKRVNLINNKPNKKD